MPFFTDQTGRALDLPSKPQRIVSVVPSQTELLSDLGLNDEVIGITKFCIHPSEWFHNKFRVGGTKKLNHDAIDSLHPDLIIANKEENTKEDIERLSCRYPVWISDIQNLTDAYEMIQAIGLITHTINKADEIIANIKQEFRSLVKDEAALHKKAAYLIWQDPYMTVGSDTFIHSMMELAGFENIFSVKSRYPEITIDEIRNSGCEILLLSSEPFPFKQKHIDELQPAMPTTKIILVDGEMFSWYGSRLLYAPSYFRQLQNDLALRHR